MGESKRYVVLKDSLGWMCLYDNHKEKYVISDGMLYADTYVKDLSELLNKYDDVVKGLYNEIHNLKEVNSNLYFYTKKERRGY